MCRVAPVFSFNGPTPEVIQVGVGVNDAHHLEAQRIELRQDQFVIAAGVDHDGFYSMGRR